MDKYVEAEKRLAELISGKEVLVDRHGLCYSVIESHLHNFWSSNYPQWARDDEAAFRLMVEHGCYPYSCMRMDSDETMHQAISITDQHEIEVLVADHTSKVAAVRFAVVQAVIAKLEGEKK